MKGGGHFIVLPVCTQRFAPTTFVVVNDSPFFSVHEGGAEVCQSVRFHESGTEAFALCCSSLHVLSCALHSKENGFTHSAGIPAT